ncbi:cytochrome c oxidase subunit II [Aggregicoccus sp. 17bor-14]|uniref:cytochrome c oxidase subunit II n=1 Tax=Myxococcaceae TaxID=31 RepID=UPI0012F409A4|nr:cytochrome c oxidase subunit II [Simulacricoccus sp. 17bor-14]MRI92225.1 cytochrome c oxidase subunit II [Aggregicoccus sp. 17bor-14]
MNELIRRLLFLPEQGSTLALRSDHLHFFILVVSFTGAFLVGAVGLVFLVRYRKREELAITPHLEAPPWLEGIFIGVPLAFFLLWFVLGLRDYTWANEPPADAMDVYVTGKQWMWKFSYPDGPSEAGVLKVPAGRPVRLLITSRDVVHSFFVPDFRMKKDAVPGRYTQLWFEAPRPGRHEVLCAEYCGLDHSLMRAQVEVLSPEDFERWRSEEGERQRQQHPPEAQEAASPPMASRGERVAAEAGCLKCHSVDGSAHIGPTFLALYGREEVLEDGRVRVDEAYLTESMMQPAARVVRGYLPVMPSYFGRLSVGEVASLVEYIKSLRPSGPPPATPQEPAYVPARK